MIIIYLRGKIGYSDIAYRKIYISVLLFNNNYHFFSY